MPYLASSFSELPVYGVYEENPTSTIYLNIAPGVWRDLSRNQWTQQQSCGD